MGLSNMKSVLSKALENHYAVGAFNVCNLEYARAAIEGAQEVGSPVIIGVHPSEIAYAGINNIAAIVKTLASSVSIPVVLHLDHGDSLETVLKCIQAGFTSVMIDGSVLPFDRNVDLTRRVVEIAHAVGVDVEGELGHVGGPEYSNTRDESLLTEPEQAARFVAETGVDSLAVSIGTVHGLYTREPKIDIPRLREIRALVSVPLVLHGGSKTPDDAVRASIQNGIAKVNVSTEFKLAFEEGVKAHWAENPSVFEPSIVYGRGIASAKRLVQAKLALFGSVGKAA